MRNRQKLVGLLVLTLAVTACTPQILSGIPGSIEVGERALFRPRLTDDDEARLAQENARKFEAGHAMLGDLGLENYLTGLLQNLVVDSEPRNFPYRVRVVADPAVNAFTFGGGLIYLHAGMIARLENEAQLAFILAHELAHVNERHVPSGIQAAYDIELGVDAAGVLIGAAGGGSGVVGDVLDKAYDYTLDAAVNGHGRAQEARADELALQYMTAARFDPREAAGAFVQLFREYGDPSPIETFFYSDHPSNTSRHDRVARLAEERYGDVIRGQPLVVNSELYKRRTRGVVIRTGILDYQSARFATARAMFEKAAGIDENDPVPYYYLGRIILETGRPDELGQAAAQLEKAVAVDAEFAPAHRELGLLYDRQGRYPEAIAALERYLELAPDADDAPEVESLIAQLRSY